MRFVVSIYKTQDLAQLKRQINQSRIDSELHLCQFCRFDSLDFPLVCWSSSFAGVNVRLMFKFSAWVLNWTYCSLHRLVTIAVVMRSLPSMTDVCLCMRSFVKATRNQKPPTKQKLVITAGVLRNKVAMLICHEKTQFLVKSRRF